jgi:hypothetical protein
VPAGRPKVPQPVIRLAVANTAKVFKVSMRMISSLGGAMDPATGRINL